MDVKFLDGTGFLKTESELNFGFPHIPNSNDDTDIRAGH